MRWAALAVLVSSAPAWGESYAYIKAGDEQAFEEIDRERKRQGG